MIDKIYRVQNWNGKDGILISEDGDFITLTKNDLPAEFKGRLLPGESVAFRPVPYRYPVGITEDERERMAHYANVKFSEQTKELIRKEQERRAQYGASGDVR